MNEWSRFLKLLKYEVRLPSDIMSLSQKDDWVLSILQNTAQLYIQPCQTNYYKGSNQTNLKPDVVFDGKEKEWETTINGIKY